LRIKPSKGVVCVNESSFLKQQPGVVLINPVTGQVRTSPYFSDYATNQDLALCHAVLAYSPAVGDIS
jgi:hypothetical protein